MNTKYNPSNLMLHTYSYKKRNEEESDDGGKLDDLPPMPLAEGAEEVIERDPPKRF